MSSASSKLDALTGLRALAALAVFVQHFVRVMDIKVNVGPMGGMAVSFFFVLSGFILVYVYKDKLTRSTTPKFYFTRFARIWPLHIACLLLIAWLTPRFLPSSDGRGCARCHIGHYCKAGTRHRIGFIVTTA